MAEPRELVEEIEQNAEVPDGSEERFDGYGVMGLPFASGHLLAMRRFPASSLGPAYTSVWHRDTEGSWVFWQDVEPSQACPRYFGSDIQEAVLCDVDLEWTGPRSLSISLDGPPSLQWSVTLTPTPMTRLMNSMSSAMPNSWWRKRAVLAAMGRMAGVSLRAGKLRMAGVAPNGQQFFVNPRTVWAIPSSEASVDGESLGAVGRLREQAQLGDFFVPQRGLFALGRAFFEPFDSSAHLATMTSEAPRG